MSGRSASRDGYGKALLELSGRDDIVVLDADLGKSTRSSWFRKQFPGRSFSLGIAEQNMVSVAAGFASCGFTPLASTFAIFMERAFEQIRNSVVRPGLPVHFCGSHGGIHTGSDGSSAQSIEDLAIFRSLPLMAVMHPCDERSAHALVIQSCDLDRPSYMRTTRNPSPIVYGDDDRILLGEANILRSGDHVAIMAIGVMVHRALQAAEILARDGVHARVIDVHTLAPLDHSTITRAAHDCGAIVTCEDHHVVGGLGSAVAEAVTTSFPVPVMRVGVKGRFGESGGSDELLDHLGLSVQAIVDAAHSAMNLRSGV